VNVKGFYLILYSIALRTLSHLPVKTFLKIKKTLYIMTVPEHYIVLVNQSNTVNPSIMAINESLPLQLYKPISS